MSKCLSIGCSTQIPHGMDFCEECLAGTHSQTESESLQKSAVTNRSIGDHTFLDTYAVHFLFEIHDPSGCLQAASTRLLNSGLDSEEQRYHHIEEARDLLNRWLELNKN